LPLRSIAVRDAQISADWVKALMQKPLRLLLVDDNAVNLLVARLMLKKCFPQASITDATSGELALKHLREESYDLVLMDMVMPDMDGIEVTRILRETFAAPANQTPVLALTASANPVDHDRCLAAGMNDVVHKPLDEAQLISKITSALVEQTLQAER
jgi:CheY-like chemotaxis protein